MKKKKFGLKIQTQDDNEEVAESFNTNTNTNNKQGNSEEDRETQIKIELNQVQVLQANNNTNPNINNTTTNVNIGDSNKIIINDKYLNEEETKSRPNANNSSEIELIKYSMNSSQKGIDLSFHWNKRIEDLAFVSKNIEILNEKFLLEPLKRDIGCEFKLIKLLTEDKQHKDNFIDLPKSMKRMNRYNDILPCKLLL